MMSVSTAIEIIGNEITLLIVGIVVYYQFFPRLRKDLGEEYKKEIKHLFFHCLLCLVFLGIFVVAIVLYSEGALVHIYPAIILLLFLLAEPFIALFSFAKDVEKKAISSETNGNSVEEVKVELSHKAFFLLPFIPFLISIALSIHFSTTITEPLLLWIYPAAQAYILFFCLWEMHILSKRPILQHGFFFKNYKTAILELTALMLLLTIFHMIVLMAGG
ncbi:MAG: hypothetical protein SVE93_02620 [Candidatus Thermoplasmatota archaeon]|nr:hypothetical protein [Candidatus Thermoplasmatota archaeon]